MANEKIYIGGDAIADAYIGGEKVVAIYTGGELVYPLGAYIIIVKKEVDTIPASGGSVSSCYITYKLRGDDREYRKQLTFSAPVSAQSLQKNVRTAPTLVRTVEFTLSIGGESVTDVVNVFQAKNETYLDSSVKIKDDYTTTSRKYEDVQMYSVDYTVMGADGSAAYPTSPRYAAQGYDIVSYYSATFKETWAWDSGATPDVKYRGGEMYDQGLTPFTVTTGGLLIYTKTYGESGRNVSVSANGYVTAYSRGTTPYTQALIAQVRASVTFTDTDGTTHSDYCSCNVYQASNEIVNTENVLIKAAYTDTTYEYSNHSITFFAYADIHADGSQSSPIVPIITYSIDKFQVDTPYSATYRPTYTWTTGQQSYGQQTGGEAGTPTRTHRGSITSGATVSFQLIASSVVNNARFDNASTGSMKADSLATTPMSYRRVAQVTATVTYNGSVTETADVYQEANIRNAGNRVWNNAYDMTLVDLNGNEVANIPYKGTSVGALRLIAYDSWSQLDTFTSGASEKKSGSDYRSDLTLSSSSNWFRIGSYLTTSHGWAITVESNEETTSRTAQVTAIQGGKTKLFTQLGEVMPIICGKRAVGRIADNWFVAVYKVSTAGIRNVNMAYAIYYNEQQQSTTIGYEARKVSGSFTYHHFNSPTDTSTTQTTKYVSNLLSAQRVINGTTAYVAELGAALELTIDKFTLTLTT